jgi:hypothetical protein
MIKECNVLGSGPSRKSNVSNRLPSIACNIPWTYAEWTVIFDSAIIDTLITNPECIDTNTKIILCDVAYNYIEKNNLTEHFKYRINTVFKYNKIGGMRKSSAHFACDWMIHLGYNKLNIYGCDNYFGDIMCTNTFTHDKENKYATENINHAKYTDDEMIKRGKEWQEAWKLMIKKYKHVEFNFVR